MKNTLFFIILILLTTLWAPKEAICADKTVTYSLGYQALTGNAGGQKAYYLRRTTEKSEWAVFANTYLQSDDRPLIGALYDLRFPLLNENRFWQFYVQTGIGITTAGPAIELVWGTNAFWIFRVDIATHIYLSHRRPIIWSYPIWLGISLPFF